MRTRTVCGGASVPAASFCFHARAHTHTLTHTHHPQQHQQSFSHSTCKLVRFCFTAHMHPLLPHPSHMHTLPPHTHTQVCTHTHTHTSMHTHTQTHTDTHRHKHTQPLQHHHHHQQSPSNPPAFLPAGCFCCRCCPGRCWRLCRRSWRTAATWVAPVFPADTHSIDLIRITSTL